jgi:hypothetical protein
VNLGSRPSYCGVFGVFNYLFEFWSNWVFQASLVLLAVGEKFSEKLNEIWKIRFFWFISGFFSVDIEVWFGHLTL